MFLKVTKLSRGKPILHTSHPKLLYIVLLMTHSDSSLTLILTPSPLSGWSHQSLPILSSARKLTWFSPSAVSLAHRTLRITMKDKVLIISIQFYSPDLNMLST